MTAMYVRIVWVYLLPFLVVNDVFLNTFSEFIITTYLYSVSLKRLYNCLGDWLFDLLYSHDVTVIEKP